MKLILIALSFFTRFPVRLKTPIKSEEFYKSMLLLPLVGLLIGFILYLSFFIIKYIHFKPVQAFILLLIYFIITGGIHYDGLSDSIDGLFSGREKDQILRIMKDAYIGTFGTLAICISVLALFISNLYIVYYNKENLLFLYPLIGRFGAIEIGALFKPYEKNQGLGYNFCQVDKPIVFFVYLVLIFFLLFFLFSNYYLISFGIIIVLNLILGFYYKNKIGGVTGDLLGLTIELNQLIFLFSYILLENR